MSKDNFAKNLKALRGKHGLTQKGLAAQLGVKRCVIGAYEEGRATPRLITLVKMLDLFDVTAQEIITEDLTVEATPSC